MKNLYTLPRLRKGRSLMSACVFILGFLVPCVVPAQTPAITVTAGIPPTGSSCVGIDYGNSIYVTVFYPNRVYTSSDGDNWTAVSSPALTGKIFTRIAYGAGLFVMVGDNGNIVTSPDGETWTSRSSGTTNYLYDVQFIQSTFFVTGNNVTLRSSADGITWNSVTVNGGAPTDMLMNITYGNGLYIIAARNNFGQAIIYRSATAVSSSWTFQNIGFDLINKVQYLKDRFFIFTAGTTVYTSTNGSGWTNSTASMPVTLPNASMTTIGSPNQAFHGIYDGTKIYLFGSAQYYSGSGSYGAIFSSTDGVNFTLQQRSLYIVCQGAAYINNRYFMYGNEGLVSSADGLTYKYYNGNYFGVASSGNGNYAAVGMVGSAGIVFTSPDFSNWVEKSPINTPELYSLVWDGGKYVAAGSKIIVQSADNGNSWSQLATPNINFNSLGYGSSKYVAAGYDGTTGNLELYYSTDATTWTVANTGPNWYFKIKYINNRFFALGTTDIYTGVVMSSTDGVNWSDITPSLSFNTIYYNDVLYDGTMYHIQGADDTYEFFSVSTATPAAPGTWANKGTITTPHAGIALGGYFGEGAFAYYGGHYVGSVNDVNTNEAYTLYSSDGISWTAVASGQSGIIGGIINESSRFMMLGSGSLGIVADFSMTTLPVKLTDFTGALVNNMSLLKWTTSVEHNSDYFLVQRSTDQSAWSAIGTVKAAGESDATRRYSFTDLQPSGGNNYYRLIQTDIDGTEQFSKTVLVKKATGGSLRVYPNPAGNNVTLDLPSPGPSLIIMYNVAGQAVYSKTTTGNKVFLSLETLPKGYYKLVVKQNEKQYAEQLLHQ